MLKLWILFYVFVSPGLFKLQNHSLTHLVKPYKISNAWFLLRDENFTFFFFFLHLGIFYYQFIINVFHWKLRNYEFKWTISLKDRRIYLFHFQYGILQFTCFRNRSLLLYYLVFHRNQEQSCKPLANISKQIDIWFPQKTA